MIRFVFTLPLDVLHTQVILKVFIFFSNIGSVLVIGIGLN